MNETSYSNYLLDTNVLLKIFNNSPDVERQLIEHAKPRKVSFILLNEILNELFKVEQERFQQNPSKYKKMESKMQVIRKLAEIGTVQETFVDYNSWEYQWATVFHRKRRLSHKRSDLSLIDCLLLKLAIENSWELVTTDHALVNALREMIESLGKSGIEVFVPHDKHHATNSLPQKNTITSN